MFEQSVNYAYYTIFFIITLFYYKLVIVCNFVKRVSDKCPCRKNVHVGQMSAIFILFLAYLFSSLMIYSSSFTFLHVNSWEKVSPGSINRFNSKSCQTQPGRCVENFAQDVITKNLWFWVGALVVTSVLHFAVVCLPLAAYSTNFQKNVIVNKREQGHQRWAQ